MAPVPTYPGIYVEELPSGAHSIAGVATSITAFLGRARRGPTDTPVEILSFADFERIFGGLWPDSTLGFSVEDFFKNGGTHALVVRLFQPDPGDAEAGQPAPVTSARLQVGALSFVAANPGSWGAKLTVNVDVDVDVEGITREAAAKLGVCTSDLFNLSVTDAGTGWSERFLNLTVKDGPRRVDRVLAAESALLAYDGDVDPAAAITVGADALAEKETAVSDGLPLTLADFLPPEGPASARGLYALEKTDLFNLLCIPPYRDPADAIDVDPELVATAAGYCERRRAMLLLDAPKPWTSTGTALAQFSDAGIDHVGTRSANAALFFPRLTRATPLRDNQPVMSSAIGAIAGVFARTDAASGVWKAPAGTEATLAGAFQPSVPLTDAENGALNPLGINCLRTFPFGVTIWGARTLRGADQMADEYKYIPVRRTALYIEESLDRGLKWAAFEPNDEPLWAQMRVSVGAFMEGLFRNSALQGVTAKDAYFVKCDRETTTQSDIDQGVVNIVVGFAPLKPAEFVILTLTQIAGKTDA